MFNKPKLVLAQSLDNKDRWWLIYHSYTSTQLLESLQELQIQFSSILKMDIQIFSQFSDFREEKCICLNCVNLSLAVLLVHVLNFLLRQLSRASAIKSVYMSMKTLSGKHTSSLIIVISV